MPQYSGSADTPHVGLDRQNMLRGRGGIRVQSSLLDKIHRVPVLPMQVTLIAVHNHYGHCRNPIIGVLRSLKLRRSCGQVTCPFVLRGHDYDTSCLRTAAVRRQSGTGG